MAPATAHYGATGRHIGATGTPYTPEPWRRRGESHKTATAIWRRYGDATITMDVIMKLLVSYYIPHE